jgi:hypothetical protein
MKKLLLAVVLIPFVLVVLFSPVPADESGWFHPRDNYYISWDGLHVAKGATLDVPYAATPYEMADEMVHLADVKSDGATINKRQWLVVSGQWTVGEKKGTRKCLSD